MIRIKNNDSKEEYQVYKIDNNVPLVAQITAIGKYSTKSQVELLIKDLIRIGNSLKISK